MNVAQGIRELEELLSHTEVALAALRRWQERVDQCRQADPGDVVEGQVATRAARFRVKEACRALGVTEEGYEPAPPEPAYWKVEVGVEDTCAAVVKRGDEVLERHEGLSLKKAQHIASMRAGDINRKEQR